MNDLIEYNLVMSASSGGTPVYGKAGVDAELAKKDKVIAEQTRLLNIAICPCCDKSGGYYDGFDRPTQCQWCAETNVFTKHLEATK